MKKKTKLLLGLLAASILSTTLMVGAGFYYFWSVRAQINTLMVRINNALDEYSELLPMVQQSLVDLNNLRMYVNITVQSMVQEGVANLLNIPPTPPVPPPPVP